MKIYKNNKLALFLLSFALFACEKDGDMPTVSITKVPTLKASESTLVLTEEEAENNAIEFTWTAMGMNWSDTAYKHNGAVNYTLEMDIAGNNFAAPHTSMSNSTEIQYTVGELNDLFMKLGMKPFEPGNIEVRLRSSLGNNLEPTYSDVITVTVTPYLAEPPYPTLYLVGDATEFDWDNAKATPMFRVETDPFLYTYTGYLQKGPVKFLGYLGKWAPQWGDAGDGRLLFRETDADADPPAIAISMAGYYTVQVNFRNLTYSITPYDTTGAPTYSSIGIIGAFNEWVDIVPMTTSSINSHTWSINYTFAADTEIKFRIASGWSVNWGPELEENQASTYGKGILNGLNIKVAAGEYNIYLNDLTGRYVLVKKE